MIRTLETLKSVWGLLICDCPSQQRPPPLSPMGSNLRRIISLSVVIVRASCGRSSKHGTSHLARLYPPSAVQGLLGAPLKAGHDDGEIYRAICANRTSSVRRKPSPKRLNADTVMKMASIGSSRFQDD